MGPLEFLQHVLGDQERVAALERHMLDAKQRGADTYQKPSNGLDRVEQSMVRAHYERANRQYKGGAKFSIDTTGRQPDEGTSEAPSPTPVQPSRP